MSRTYDPATPLGMVRLLACDFALKNALFEDEDYQAMLTLNSQVIRLAAAQALDIIATNEIMVQKQIKTLDLSTNGPAQARELQALAKELRRQEYDGAGDLTGMFDYAEMVYDAFSSRERVVNQWLRT